MRRILLIDKLHNRVDIKFFRPSSRVNSKESSVRLNWLLGKFKGNDRKICILWSNLWSLPRSRLKIRGKSLFSSVWLCKAGELFKQSLQMRKQLLCILTRQSFNENLVDDRVTNKRKAEKKNRFSKSRNVKNNEWRVERTTVVIGSRGYK